MKAKNMLENLSKKFKLDKRVIIIALVGILGIVLLTLSELAPENGQEKAQAEKNEPLYAYEEQLEERLTKLIGSINGAGRTGVMVTLESTDENVYATQDKYSENSGEKDYVIVKKGGGDDGLLLKVAEPQVRGVAVVCDGADSAQVRQEITAAVTAVLGISTNRVSIAKMNSNGGKNYDN